VSTIIANAHLPLFANLLNGTKLEGIFFQGIFTDLTPNWCVTALHLDGCLCVLTLAWPPHVAADPTL
jgi:hypothetical protein